VERALGLMAGAGVLPGRAAEEATRQGWRVVAFAFEDAPGLHERCHAVIPSRIDNIQKVLEELTAREMEVLQLLAEGLPNKSIAQRLDISEHTVKFHVNAILRKLEAQSRTEAVVQATRLGLILL